MILYPVVLIIFTWRILKQRLNSCLHGAPKVDFTKHGIQPTGSDAVVAIERDLMVNFVLFTRESDVVFLQETHNGGRVHCVAPLVDLVGHRYKERSR